MKGLAITGVVIGHLGIEILETIVNYWHLPVFFFVSGYFLKEKHLNDWKKYINSRFCRLIIPFLLYAIVALFLHNVLLDMNLISGTRYDIEEYAHGFRQILFLSSSEQLIGATWFLPALFISSLFGLVTVLSIKRCKYAIYIWGELGLLHL